MSGHWIRLNDIRVNVCAQQMVDDPMPVIDALINLYQAPVAELNREFPDDGFDCEGFP